MWSVNLLPHGIAGRYLVLSKTKDYLNPSGNTITIGAGGVTLTSALEEDILGQESRISTEIRFDFTQVMDEIKVTVAENPSLLEEYIRFKGALIELGRVGNAFTAELSGESLAFKENGQKIAYISNQSLVITNAEIGSLMRTAGRFTVGFINCKEIC